MQSTRLEATYDSWAFPVQWRPFSQSIHLANVPIPLQVLHSYLLYRGGLNEDVYLVA